MPKPGCEHPVLKSMPDYTDETQTDFTTTVQECLDHQCKGKQKYNRASKVLKPWADEVEVSV